MPRYLFQLHDGPETPPVVENINARDDRDAEDLARIRLLLTREYTQAQVYRGGDKVADLKRDSAAT